MRKEPGAETDRAIGVVARVEWTVVEARAISDRVLAVRFIDGTEGQVDLSALIDGAKAGVFKSLRDEAVFRSVTVTDGAVSWPNGLDLAPDAMYDAIKETGFWAP
jgi:hypothetical protein